MKLAVVAFTRQPWTDKDGKTDTGARSRCRTPTEFKCRSAPRYSACRLTRRPDNISYYGPWCDQAKAVPLGGSQSCDKSSQLCFGGVSGHRERTRLLKAHLIVYWALQQISFVGEPLGGRLSDGLWQKVLRHVLVTHRTQKTTNGHGANRCGLKIGRGGIGAAMDHAVTDLYTGGKPIGRQPSGLAFKDRQKRPGVVRVVSVEMHRASQLTGKRLSHGARQSVWQPH